ncbi:MAG TPA: ATP-binding protein [Bacteroidia bacterium]
MTGITRKKDPLTFEYLPAFADFLLKHKLDEFVKASLFFSKEEGLSLLNHLAASFSDEQLIAIGKGSSSELLLAVSHNDSASYIANSMKKWKENQLIIIDQGDIAAEDITLTAFIRRKIFRSLLNAYSTSDELQLKILEEVDRFTTQTELLSYSAYIEIQQKKLSLKNEELLQREAQLLEAQTIAEMGSFLWDMTDSSKSVYTPQVMKIFGMSQAGKLEDFIQFVHKDDRAKLKQSLDNALNNHGSYECEYRYIRNGAELFIASKGIVEFQNNKAVRMRGTVRDITKKYKMLNQLNELNLHLSAKNMELERTNKELESFNYIASHDLQEPLRKIQTFSSRLMDSKEQLPKVIVEYVDKINVSSQRMKNLIEDLLSFSQISSPSDAFEQVDLNIILHEARQLLSEPIEKSEAVIQVASLPKINAIPFQFLQLFINLISNSIKYKKENTSPLISISASLVNSSDINTDKVIVLPGPYLQLSIIDNGIGFEPAYTEKIFDLFKRLHAKEKYSGTGIGLSICKKIVTNHNGFITAESENEEGATFRIYLPAERVVEMAAS